MPKKPKLSPDDLNTFREAVKGVKPLTQKKNRITPPSPPPHFVKRQSSQQKSYKLYEGTNVEPVQGEEFITFKHASISNKTLSKLRKGQYNIEAMLDLHGMTVAAAKAATERFLQDCLHNEIRVALIIHGKGHHSQMPILKNKLNDWLREIPVVLAFCSAAPEHGSRGAMYILLKRNAHEEEDMT